MEFEQTVDVGPGPKTDVKNDLIPELRSISANESSYNSLTLLIVTIILFFSGQIISVKWQEILILIGVLLFHESGHLIAMKLLKYNDVKMFFIPFLGAAVSGKPRNDTAVKSCIVSLMGPLPGIILGVFLYFLFGITKNYYVLKTSQVMLLLNAFNMLPIMPLDGGRYIDVLFINRRYFRLFFAFIGSAIFMFLAISTKDFVIGIIGIFSIYAAFSKFKVHGLCNDLRCAEIKAASVADLIEDEHSMQIVTEKLEVKYPKLFSPSVSYKSVLEKLTVVIDTLKFIPAKLISKTLLLFSYIIIILSSIIVTFFFLATNYTEKSANKDINGKSYVYSEHYYYGKKGSECPINDALFYDGKGTGYDLSSGYITDAYYYSNGYRTGEWLQFNQAGDTIEKRNYDKGSLISLSKLENGQWRTYTVKELPFLKRCSEEIQRISQPYKSNHRYF